MTDLRNVLIHEYFGVNMDIVWKTIQDDLPEGGSFYSTFHFCEKCAGKIVMPLVKSFPAINK